MSKKIIRLKQSEEAEYYCDITGEFLDFEPPARLSISFGYGSKKDGSSYEWQFSDEESDRLLGVITKYLIKRKTRVIKDNIAKQNEVIKYPIDGKNSYK